MKHILLLTAIVLSSKFCLSDSISDLLIGRWVKTRITFQDGAELPENQKMKYQYTRFTFEKPNKVYISFAYQEKGTALTFTISDKQLELVNSYGFSSNRPLAE